LLSCQCFLDHRNWNAKTNLVTVERREGIPDSEDESEAF
jgi:hypothetical protein